MAFVQKEKKQCKSCAETRLATIWSHLVSSDSPSLSSFISCNPTVASNDDNPSAKANPSSSDRPFANEQTIFIGPTSHYFVSQRLRLHYVDWGNQHKPLLLLIHGGRDHCRSFDWMAKELREDFHIIAPDLRGHGDSQWYCASLFYVMLCYVLCYVMLCYVMLCYVMLCYVMLCYVMLCYMMLLQCIVFSF